MFKETKLQFYSIMREKRRNKFAFMYVEVDSTSINGKKAPHFVQLVTLP